ncbi:MAG: hypothetical protein HZA19_00845, partial [Nitrospirae bacterium]|nr:hypothetical protein [Nitrospirota bacterium]
MKRASPSGALLILMILILGACQTVSQSRPDSPAAAPEEKSAATPGFKELNDLGVQFLRHGMYDEAFIKFQKAL